MKVIGVVQARMSSTRLPGKVLFEIQNKTILEHIIDRLNKSKLIDEVIIATSTDKEDDAIEDLAKRVNIGCIRGSLKNVLERYYIAALKQEGDIIVRVTGDCPCLDYKIIDRVIGAFKENNNLDYMNNTFENRFPRGYDVEVFTRNALVRAYKNAEKDYEKEHVTPYIYDEKNKFNIKVYHEEKKYPQYRVTLDTVEDLKVIEKIFEKLYDKDNFFGIETVVEYLNEHKEILTINKDIKQKKIGE